jgi:hypothetical protein
MSMLAHHRIECLLYMQHTYLARGRSLGGQEEVGEGGGEEEQSG